MPEAIKISVDLASLAEMRESFARQPQRLKRAVSGAINDTARHEVSFISQEIRRRVNLKREDINPHIHRTTAGPTHLEAIVTLEKSERIGLSHFGARQTAKGVSYLIAKGGARKVAAHAFIVASLGGNVFARLTKKRLPIRKLLGISAWGAFVKAGGRKLARVEAERYLTNRIEHRLQYASGGEY